MIEKWWNLLFLAHTAAGTECLPLGSCFPPIRSQTTCVIICTRTFLIETKKKDLNRSGQERGGSFCLVDYCSNALFLESQEMAGNLFLLWLASRLKSEGDCLKLFGFARGQKAGGLHKWISPLEVVGLGWALPKDGSTGLDCPGVLPFRALLLPRTARRHRICIEGKESSGLMHQNKIFLLTPQRDKKRKIQQLVPFSEWGKSSRGREGGENLQTCFIKVEGAFLLGKIKKLFSPVAYRS